MALDRKMLVRIGVGTAAAVVLCGSVVTCSNLLTRIEKNEQRIDQVEQMGIDQQETITKVAKTTEEVVKTTNKLTDKVLKIRDELLDSLAVTNGKLNKLDSLQRAQKPCLCNPTKGNTKPEKPAKPIQPAKPVKPVQTVQPMKPVVVVAPKDSVVVPSSGNTVVNSGAAQSQINGNTEVNFENGINNGTVIINNGGVINQTGIKQSQPQDSVTAVIVATQTVRKYVYRCGLKQR